MSVEKITTVQDSENILKNFSKLSWKGLVLSFLFVFVLGGLWYTLLFKDAYASSLDKLGSMPENPDPIYIYGPAITIIPTLIATALLMSTLKISSIKGALGLALVLGIGFLVANTFNIAINPNFPHPFFYGLVTGSYQLISSFGISLIIYRFQQRNKVSG